MDRRHLIGLGASLVLAAIVAWLTISGDIPAMSSTIDGLLLFMAAAALMLALLADPAPLARISKPSLLAFPAVMAGAVAALQLVGGALLAAISAGMVAGMFVVIWYRAEQVRSARQP